MQPIERLGELGNQFESWLRETIPGGENSKQGRRIKPLADGVFRRFVSIQNTIASGALSDAENGALVDDFALEVEQAKRSVLQILSEPEQEPANPLGVFLVAGLALGALIYFTRK